MEIRVDGLSSQAIRELLEEHLRNMRQISPPESVHALDIGALREPDITFWSVWNLGALVGCGALRELNKSHGEVKSMRTKVSQRRSGVGSAVLTHILEVATSRGYERVSLETGSQPEFNPARKLYEKFGFSYCRPFGEYVDDPNSVFMTKLLE